MKKIAIIVASVNKNMELAQSLKEITVTLHAKADIIDLVRLNLPMYTSVLEDEKGIPSDAIALTKSLLSYDAFIVVAPEYNYLIPPVLVNAVAWVSRDGDDFRAIFNQKFIALATYSGGGGDKAIQSMAMMFSYLGANILSRHILSNPNKPYKEKTAISVVEELLRHA